MLGLISKNLSKFELYELLYTAVSIELSKINSF